MSCFWAKAFICSIKEAFMRIVLLIDSSFLTLKSAKAITPTNYVKANLKAKLQLFMQVILQYIYNCKYACNML